jgi:hypothetical protein
MSPSNLTESQTHFEVNELIAMSERQEEEMILTRDLSVTKG